MEDEITSPEIPETSAPVMDTADTGVDEPKVTENEAELETQDESTNSVSESDEIAEQGAESDENYDEFLRNKGINPEDPDALSKVAKMAANSEKAMHAKAKQASELEKIAAQPSQYGDSVALAKVNAMERKEQVREYRERSGLTPDVEQEMARILDTASPLYKEQYRQGLLGLEDLHAKALFNLDHKVDKEAIKAEGRTEALKSLAAKQRAAFPRGNATHGSEYGGVSKANVEAWYQGLSAEERKKPETQKKLDELLN